MFVCIYCSKTSESKKGNSYHQRRCKLNQDRIKASGKNANWLESMSKRKGCGTNQYTKAKRLGLSKPLISDETRLKLSESASIREYNLDCRNKLSIAAKKRGFGGITQSRWINYNGKKLGSSYELEVAKSLDENHVRWDTCKRFSYLDPTGKIRTYTPDFYLIDYDIYLDPKNDFLINNVNPSLGYSDSDKIKLAEDYNNIKVIILSKKQLSWDIIKELITLKYPSGQRELPCKQSGNLQEFESPL